MKSIFVLAVVAVLATCGSAGEWQDFGMMSWQPGDQVACLYHGFAGFMGMKNWMLVASRDQILHLAKNKTIVQQHYATLPKNFRWDRCINEGQGKHGVQAVQRATEMLNMRVYTTFWVCSSKDYVKYWADGDKSHYFCTYPESVDKLFDAEQL